MIYVVYFLEFAAIVSVACIVLTLCANRNKSGASPFLRWSTYAVFVVLMGYVGYQVIFT